jgi:hypothetical protein
MEKTGILISYVECASDVQQAAPRYACAFSAFYHCLMTMGTPASAQLSEHNFILMASSIELIHLYASSGFSIVSI